MPTDLLLFALSAGLLVGTTLLVARLLARTLTELLWLLPACVSLQIGTLACGLSFGGRMVPRWWLAGQATLLAGVLLWARRRPHPEPLHAWKSLRDWWTSAPALARGAAATALLFVVLSGFRQTVEPVSGFDDRMYHASRAAYWMQNASILPYPTHNERQVAFPFGSELYFLWPVLFTKWEAAGRLVFWLGFPMAAIGIHTVAGKAGVREPFRSFAVLLFVSTPIVSSQSLGLTPELWLTVFELGTAYWILEAATAGNGSGAVRAAGWVGVFFLLAMNVKTTALGLAIPAAVFSFVVVGRAERWPASRALVIGAVAGWILSGLLLNNIGNLARWGNPFAPAGLRAVVRSDFKASQLYIHAVRLPFVLFELPWVPAARRQGLEAWGEAAATALGATQPISFEDSKWGWPGRFHFTVPPTARNYSLGGILWLPGLAGALVVALLALQTAGRGRWRDPLLLCALFALSSLVPVVFGLRWMVQSGVPVRFLIAPWALGAICLSALASRFAAAHGSIAVVAAVLAGGQALAALPGNWEETRALLKTPTPDVALDEPFSGILPHLPPGSRILLFAHQDTRDYPLFRPREGFANRVTAWGDESPSKTSVLKLVYSTRATGVLFVGSEAVFRSGDASRPSVPTSLRVAGVIQGMADDPHFRHVPLEGTDMQLFEIVGRP